VESATQDTVSAQALAACEQLHRYELAGRLCAGLRVADLGRGGPGAEMLRERAAQVQSDVGDLQQFLAGDLTSQFDALVLIDDSPDPTSVWGELARHAQAGLRLVVSVPNRRAVGEDGKAPAASVGYEEAMELFSQFEDVVPVYQFPTEGSLLALDPSADARGKVVLVDRAEAEYASRFLACVNFGGPEPIASAVGARMQLNAAPVANRYLRQLERANRELRRANTRLGRERLGTADAAAARHVHDLERRIERLEQRAAEAEAALHERETRLAEIERVMDAVWNSVSWRITRPLRTAKERLQARLRR
jgi:uncharacterized coiled-coil protein SlyX